MTETTNSKAGLFPALLKYWRNSRGLSQLDLSLAAEVSARHVSFLETGRAKPSKEMVLTLANALQVPLREQNKLLHSAGFETQFEEPSIQEILQGPMGKVVQFIPNALGSRTSINVFEAVFDPELARPYIQDWEITARKFLSNMYRASLLNSHDSRLRDLINKVFTYPNVPEQWRQPDLLANNDPTLTVRFKKGDLELTFLTTLVQFTAPQNVTLEELRIESYLPVNDKTDQYVKQFFQ